VTAVPNGAHDGPAGGRVVVRSYAIVLDRLDRRLFKLDRWRLPFPHGLELRALAYAASCLLLVLVASRLPLAGGLLGLLPAPIHWGLLPFGGAFALARWRPDGRAPHRTLRSLVRHACGPRELAGLRRCPRSGSVLVPLVELVTFPDWRTARYRAGRIRGPAKLTLRYPASCELRGSAIWVEARSGEPLFAGKLVEVPAGGELVIR
jgi:hypothetical protein